MQPEKNVSDKNQLQSFREERLSFCVFPRLNYIPDIEITDVALHMNFHLLCQEGDGEQGTELLETVTSDCADSKSLPP